jgi:hypothetical protein
MQMQKLVLSVLLPSAAIGTAHAQTESSKLLLGGNISYYSNAAEGITVDPAINSPLHSNNKMKQGSFIPQIGFFVADNLALGISLGFTGSKQTVVQDVYDGNANLPSIYTYSSEYSYKTLSAGPFVRYYKMLGEKVGFYGQLGAGYQSGTQRQFSGTQASTRATSNGGYAAITPHLFSCSQGWRRAYVRQLVVYQGEEYNPHGYRSIW